MRSSRFIAAIAFSLALVGGLVPQAGAQEDIRGVVVGGPAAIAPPVETQFAQAIQKGVERVAGDDRFATAAELAERFPVGSPVLIASGRRFADALSAGPLATLLSAPILLVEQERLPEATAAALRRLTPRTVTVLGGPVAVSEEVVAEIGAITGQTPVRVAGPDRYATAAAVANSFTAPAAEVWVVSGESFTDALSGGAAAAAQGVPLLLIRPTSIPEVILDAIARLAPGRIVLVGTGDNASDDVEADLRAIAPVTRLGGQTPHETAAIVARETWRDGAAMVYLASADDFADALAVAPVAAGQTGRFAQASGSGPVLLTPPDDLPSLVGKTAFDLLRDLPVLVVEEEEAPEDNTIPQVADVSATTPASTPVNVRLLGSDADGDALTYAVVSPPSRGSATISGATLTYTPSGSSGYTESFTYQACDADICSASATVRIQVTPTPSSGPGPSSTSEPMHPVVNLNPGGTDAPNYVATFTEDGPAVAVANAATATVSDADSTNLTSLRVTLNPRPDGAAERLIGVPSGAVTVAPYDAATGVLLLNGPAPVADFQAALRRITYANADQAPDTAARTVTVVARDPGGLNSASVTSTVTVRGVNDPATVTMTSAPLAYTEGAPATQVDPNLTVTDPDNTTLQGATVTIAQNLQTGDQLALPTAQTFAQGAGITSTVNGGVLTLSGQATLSEYQQALRSVTYRHLGDTPQTPKRIEVRVDDGTGPGPIASRTIAMTPVNDRPVVTTSAGTVTFTENDGPVTVDPAVTVTDPDSPQMASARVRITTGHNPQQDALGITVPNNNAFAGAQAGITTGYDAATGELTLTGVAPLADYQAVLRQVTFTNTSDNPSPLNRTIVFEVTDAGPGGSQVSDIATRAVRITAVSDKATVTLSNGALPYSEGDPATTFDTALVVVDPDSTNLTAAEVQITTGYQQGSDQLSSPGALPGGLTASFDLPSGTLLIQGTAALADYQSALRSITYNSTSNAPGTSRTVRVRVDDGSGYGPPAERQIAITPNNEAPVVTVGPSEQDANYTQGDNTGVEVTQFMDVADPDSAQISGATVSIVTNFQANIDVLSFTDQNGIQGTYNPNTGVLTLTGNATPAVYTAALRAVRFRQMGNGGTTETRTVRFQVTDDTAVPSNTLDKQVHVRSPVD